MFIRPFTLSICALLIAIFLSVPSLADVTWSQASFDDILEAAKKENKHVFIDFYAVWCGPCKQLGKVTYKDPKVIEFLNAIIPVKYDAEKGVGEILAKRFRVKAYPTLVLLGPDGEEIDRHLGYLDPEQFLNTMQDYQKGIGTVQYYEEMLKKTPDDLEIHHILGTKYADALRTEEAAVHLGKVIEQDPSNKLGFTDKALFALAETRYRTDDHEKASLLLKKLLKDFPDSKMHDHGLQMLARTYHKLGDANESIKTYMQYVDRHPDDPNVLNSFAWFCASRQIGLDRALPVAKKAVELSNEAPTILDTLAELYYARGEYEKAIEIGEKALEKEPDDLYYKNQIKKFRDALEERSKKSD